MAPASPDLREVCKAGESAAREFVLSRVDKRLIRSLNINISSEKREGTVFSVDVTIDVDPVLDIDVENLADQAAGAALDAIDVKMRGSKLG